MSAGDFMPESPAAAPGRRAPWWPGVIAAAVVVAILAAVSRVDLKPALQWIKAQGVWAPLVFCALYAVCTVVLIPGSLMTLGAGAVFGFGWGLLWVTMAANLGANAAFLIGRFAARNWVERRVSTHPKFAAIDAAVGHEGWKIVGLLRLSPVFPFTLLNYALGVTRVTWRDYAIASLIGMMPGTCLYVYLGHAIGDAVLTGAAHDRTTAERAALWIGLAATAVVTVFITRIARRALTRQLDETSDSPHPDA